MTVQKRRLLIGTAIVLTGLSAGLLFAYSVSIIPAFKTLTDEQYVAAMQNINVSIQNGVFFIAYFGALFALAALAWKYKNSKMPKAFKLFLAAFLIYFIGTIIVTVAGNVPLNNKLALFKRDNASAQDITKARKDYESPWNALHTVRTVAAVAALGTVTAGAFAAVEGDKKS